MSKSKEMTMDGPVSRIGDYLEACLHRSFTNEADLFLQEGRVSREERIALSGAISAALNAFRSAAPSDVLDRRVREEHMMPESVHSYSLKKTIDGAIDWLFGSKESYDSSPWDGSASQWKTAAAYCSDCLIDTNPAGSEKSKDKCHLPYRKPGSKAINKNALRAMASGGRGIKAVKGITADQKKKAAKWIVEHWKAAFDRPAPDSMHRMAGMKAPTAADKSSVSFFKDRAGQWWVVMMYSNKWEDREDDILSEKSHKDFSDWVNKTKFRPMITLFHQPVLPDEFWLKAWKKYKNDIPKLQEVVRRVYRDTGAAIGEVERVSYLNGFALMLGKIYPEKVEVAKRLSKMKGLGNSHVFVATDFKRRKDSGIIVNEYRSFEGSILPRRRAANLVTLPIFQEKSMGNSNVGIKLSEEDQGWLEEALGPEGARALVDHTAEMEKDLDAVLAFKATSGDIGEEDLEPEFEETDTKAKDPDPEDEEEDSEDEETAEEKSTSPAKEDKPEPASVDPEFANKVFAAMRADELQGVIHSLLAKQTTLENTLAELKTELAAVKTSEDERVAAMFAPNWSGNPFFQASQSEETALDSKEAKKKVKEGPKTDAKAADPKNPLQFGFWGMMPQQPQQ